MTKHIGPRATDKLYNSVLFHERFPLLGNLVRWEFIYKYYPYSWIKQGSYPRNAYTRKLYAYLQRGENKAYFEARNIDWCISIQ